MPNPKNFQIFPKMPHSEMVFVKGGSFRMGSDDEDALGSEKPIHTITVPDFYIGKYPVTQAIWEKVMNNNPSYYKGKNRPVEQVSWNTIIQEFLPKLKELTGKEYNLPSEAIWEYAAKGGTLSKEYKYAGSNDLNGVGWYNDNSHQETKPVGLKAPNELDLYDMNGNVWEWCLDHWHNTYDNAPNDANAWVDVNAEKGKSRVIRGGSWSLIQRNCRPSYRFNNHPDFAFNFIGFRLVFSFTSQK